MKPAVPPTVSMDGPGSERSGASSSRGGDAQKGAYDKSKQIKLTLKSSTSAKPVSRCEIEHQSSPKLIGSLMFRF